MKAVFLFDLQSYFKRWGFCLVLVFMIALGFFAGQNARFSVSDAVFHNSPYQISYLVAFVSLTTLFFSTVFASQLVLKEFDNRFELLFFSTPITKQEFILGRYFSLLFITFFCVTLFTVCFLSGQLSHPSALKSEGSSILYYLFPLFFFTFINTFFATAFLSFVGWLTKNKLMVYVNGLLLYILYMIALIYSSSPFMAQSLPQSEQAKWISAIADPFGLSAFFYQTSQWSVSQRNSELISLDGLFIANRMMVLGISCLLLFICAKRFSFIKKGLPKKPKIAAPTRSTAILPYQSAPVYHNRKTKIAALFSFVKINLIYVAKSIPFVLTALILLFAVGMEMYAEIEKGIRIPQKYATSGLMASTIIQNFYFMAIIVVLYYSHDLFWRSKNANFNLIEGSTPNIKANFLAQWISISMLIFIFSIMLILEGIAFQVLYDYTQVEWAVYANVFIFNSFPLLLLCGFVLSIQKLVRQRYIALGVTGLFAFIMATPFGKQLIRYPLLRFLNTIAFDYSDMNGFGMYLPIFVQRLAFGFLLLAILFLMIHSAKNNSKKWPFIVSIILLGIISYWLGSNLVNGYQPKSESAQLEAQAHYEKEFRKYQNTPQPTITDVKTTVALFPKENKYAIKGVYTIENKTSETIEKILVNFPDDFVINEAVYSNGTEKIKIGRCQRLIGLKQKLLPNQKALFQFDISYQWKAVNGHQSFNAIVENGSFMRISRYYPSFGYDPGNEIEEDYYRKQFQLGNKTPVKSFDAPKSPNNEFINLDMVISTAENQTAIGVGELKKRWREGNRNYFQYRTASPIPFRFAVSSAQYAVKKEIYRGKAFEIYYHPKHWENVDHLLENAKTTMEYCEANFGKYPFKIIRFAEVSGFTKGFAATAYPATIFMAEDMVFHSNLKADKQQDVINELAGHELSHLWWGNSQIHPDERDGSAMLTETLAMYTEMMLLKKMYGKEKMQERLKMHEDIYNNEKGFTDDEPLYKVKGESTHISYSKGALAMCRLSDLIGEDKVNLALRNFLNKHKYPNPQPVSTDFLNEVYNVADKSKHQKIKELFMD
jgi:ABC-2 type transport system permease protein